MLLEAIYFTLNALALHVTDRSIKKALDTLIRKYRNELGSIWRETILNVAKDVDEFEKELLINYIDKYDELFRNSTEINEQELREQMISDGITSQTLDILFANLKTAFQEKIRKILSQDEELFREFAVEKLNRVNETLEEVKAAIEKVAMQRTNMSFKPGKYYYVSGVKEIWIKNSRGDANIHRKWLVKNNSSSAMEKLVFDIQHEDDLKIPACKIDGQMIKGKVQTTKLNDPFKEDIYRFQLPFLTRVSVNLEDFRIQPQSVFLVELLEEAKSTFRNMQTGEFSNTYVKTLYEQSLTTIIHTSENHVFEDESISWEVVDDTCGINRDEISRLTKSHPVLSTDKTVLSWTVISPVIGNNYTLKFRINKTNPNSNCT